MDKIETRGWAKASAGEAGVQPYPAVDQKYAADVQFNIKREEIMIRSTQISKLRKYLESHPNACRIREEGASYDVQP